MATFQDFLIGILMVGLVGIFFGIAMTDFHAAYDTTLDPTIETQLVKISNIQNITDNVDKSLDVNESGTSSGDTITNTVKSTLTALKLTKDSVGIYSALANYLGYKLDIDPRITKVFITGLVIVIAFMLIRLFWSGVR